MSKPELNQYGLELRSQLFDVLAQTTDSGLTVLEVMRQRDGRSYRLQRLPLLPAAPFGGFIGRWLA